jgi:hypothetical protein
MPVNSVQVYLQRFIDGLALPGGLPALAAYITPPDPNEATDIPTAYVWPSDGDESRNAQKGGTVPRNTGPGTPSGWKNMDHSMSVWIVYFGQDDDDQADIIFPAVVDAVMYRLRTAPDPAEAVDPYTQQLSWLLDIGEVMSYSIDLRALADQRYNRYDGKLVLQITEVFQALSDDVVPADDHEVNVVPAESAARQRPRVRPISRVSRANAIVEQLLACDLVTAG